LHNTSSHLRWLLTTAAFALLLLGLVEGNYRYGVRCPRNEIDAKLLDLERVNGKHFRVVLFSDSMTHNPARSFQMADDVLDLTTTNGPTLLGIKFMLQRLYGAGGSVEDAVVFLRPEFFNFDPAQAVNWIFLYFNREEELAELSQYGTRGYVSYEVYLRNRLDALNFSNYLLTRSRLTKVPFDGQYVLEKGVVADHLKTVDDADFGATATAQRIVRTLTALCERNGTRLTYVLEPLTSEDHRRVPGSDFERFFQRLADSSPGVRYLDASNLATFPDEAFFDGVHPRQNWGKYYLAIIDRRVVRLFR